MTDSPAPEPVAETLPSPPPAEPANAALRPLPPRHGGRSPVAVLGAIGLLLAFGGLFYLWLQIQGLAGAPAVDPARVAALETQVRDLRQRGAEFEQRLSRLEQRPVAAPLATTPPMTAPAATAPAAAVPAAAAPAPAGVDLAPLEARIAALEQRPAAPVAADPRLDALTQRLGQDEARAQAESHLLSRLRGVQAAEVALAAGQALGPIVDAPPALAPALARFATARPPTEAGLRLSFADAARRAAAASQPDLGQLSLGQRMWRRIESLVTVRRGDKVIVGAPAAVVLEDARTRLDAGDLAGCVAALAALDPAAAAAMAEWRGQAQALLDARDALAATLAALAHG